MSEKPNLQAIKSANGDRKRRLQSIHRVIDNYRPERNADACMMEICRQLGRVPRVSIINGKEG